MEVSILIRIGKYPTITFAQEIQNSEQSCSETFDGYSGRNRWILIPAVVTIVGSMLELESPGPLFFLQKGLGKWAHL
ncbi:MAG: hypothetical protein ACLSH0_09605 [Mediterraneibacter faecis]